MSQIVDNRIVSLEFQNKEFEKNAKQSMSTLDKLKEKFQFKDSSKDIDSMNSSLKKVTFDHMANGLDNVKVKFNALSVVSATVLSNITNKVMAATSKIVNMFAIAPVTSGLQEFETQMDAIQTILANTKSKGSTIDDVNEALNDLNHYADKTIYNFTQMTKNIGTFTAAGIGLKDSQQSIKGIANLAAVSGSNAEQASRAMYQLSQALSAGKVNLQDWNSVVNSGMGGEVFQNALIRTSELLGTGAKEAIEAEGTFRQSLSKSGWLTKEVLTETLKQFAGAYDEADLMAQGFNKEQAKEIADLAKTAEEAATKVKTWHQLIDTLSEAAQSGWTQTWQLIFGDFYQTREFFTYLSDTFGGIIEAMSNARNSFLQTALNPLGNLNDMLSEANIDLKSFQETSVKIAASKGWFKEEKAGFKGVCDSLDKVNEKYGSFIMTMDQKWLTTDVIIETLEEMAGETTSVGQAAEKATLSQKELNKVVNDVINGKYGHGSTKGSERYDALTKAGYDFAQVQNEVNRLYGVSKRYKEADIKLTQEQTKATGEEAVAQERARALLAKWKSDDYKEVSEIGNMLVKTFGRDLLIGSIKNVIEAVISFGKTVKGVYDEIIPKMNSLQLYDLLVNVNNFTKGLNILDKEAEGVDKRFIAIRETFKTLFTAVVYVKEIFQTLFSTTFSAVKTILSGIDIDFVELAKVLGDITDRVFVSLMSVIFSLSDGIASLSQSISKILTPASRRLVPILKVVGDAFATVLEIITGLLSGGIPKAFDFLSGAISFAADAFGNLSGSIRDFASSSFSYLSDKASKVSSTFSDFGTKVSKKLNPNLKVLDKLSSGISKTFETLWTGVKKVSKGFVDFVASLNLSDAMSSLIAGAINLLADAITGLSDIITKIADSNGFKKFVQVIQNGLENLRTYAGTVIKKIVEIFGNLRDVFSQISISDKFSEFWEMLKEFWGSIGDFKDISIEKILELFNKLRDAIVESLTPAIDAAKKKFDSFKKGVDDVAEKSSTKWAKIEGFIKPVWEAIKKYGTPILKFLVDVFTNIGAVSAILLGYQLVKFAKSLMTLFTGVVGPLNTLKSTFATLKSAIKDFGRTLNAAQIFLIAGSILVLATAVSLLALVAQKYPEGFEKAVKIITLMAGALVLVGLFFDAYRQTTAKAESSDSGDKKKTSFTTKLLIIAASVALIAGAVWALSKIAGPDLKKAVLALADVIAIVVIALWAMGKIVKESPIQAASILAFAASTILFAYAIKILSDIDFKIAGRNLLSILTIIIVLKMVAMAGSKVGPNAAKGGAAILLMSLSLFVIIGVISMLALVPAKILAEGIVKLSILLVIIAILAVISRASGENSSKGAVFLIGAATALIIMSMALTVLAFIPWPKILKGIVAIVALTFCLKQLLAVSNANPAGARDVTALGIVIMMLAGSIAILGFIPWKNLLAGTLALVGIMLTLMFVIKTIGSTSVKKEALLSLVAFVLLLVVIQRVLNSIETKGLFKKVLAIRALLSGLGKAMNAINESGNVDIKGALIKLVLITAFLAIVSGIMYLLVKNLSPVESLMILPIALGLSALLIGLCFAAQLMGTLGTFGPSIIMGMKVVGLLGAFLLAAIAALGSLSEFEMLQKGLEFLIILGESLGLAIGYFLGGIGEGLTAALAKAADNLKSFAESISEFVDTMSKIDASQMSTLTGLFDSLASLAGGSIAALFGNLGNSYGTMLKNLVEPLATFLTKLQGLEIDTKKVDVLTGAIKAIAETAESVPSTDGLMQKILGTKDLGKFVESLPGVATSINTMLGSLESMKYGETDRLKVEQLCSIIKSMTEVANTIPPAGGVLQDLIGAKNIKDFAYLVYQAANPLTLLISFLRTKEITDADNEKVKQMVGVLKTFSEEAKNLPEDPGWLDKFLGGSMTLSDFGDEIYKFGVKYGQFYDYVAYVNAEKMDSVLSDITAMIGIFSTMSSVDKKKVENYLYCLERLGTIDFDSIISNVSGKGAALRQSGLDLMGAFIDAMVEKSTDVSEILYSVVLKASDGLMKLYSVFKDHGTMFAKRIGEGFEKNYHDIVTHCNNALTKVITSVRGTNYKFIEAGEFLAEGLAVGMENKTNRLQRAAKGMVASVVEDGVYEAALINSPSKVMIEAGEYMGDGLAIGIDRKTKLVTDVAYGFGSNVVSSMSAALSSVGMAMLDDTYTPVLTPVVNLGGIYDNNRLLNSMNLRAGRITSDLGIRIDNSIDDMSLLINSANKIVSLLQNGSNITIDGKTLIGYVDRKLGTY